MSKQPDQQSISRLVVEAIDAEFVKEGQEQGIPEEITRQKLAESRRMADRYEEMLAQGYTAAQIDSLWANKTPQEILAGTPTTQTTPHTEQGGTTTEASLEDALAKCSVEKLVDIASILHFENDQPINASRHGMLALIRNGVRREGKWQALAEAIDRVRKHPH